MERSARTAAQTPVSERDEARAGFLKAARWGDAKVVPLAGDASSRRYFRLLDGAKSALLMDAPPRAETQACPADADEAARLKLGYNAAARLAGPDLAAFVGVSDYLRKAGFAAPRVDDVDFENGFAIIEDFGDALFQRALAAGADERDVYEAAARVLIDIAAMGPPPQTLVARDTSWPLLAYDAVALRTETDLFLDWWRPHFMGGVASDDLRASFNEAWTDVFTLAATDQPTLTLRDYHAENLIWRAGEKGRARIGLLDFQDALAGHGAYDLVSLLEDARRDVATDLADRTLAFYTDEMSAADPAFDAERFSAAYAALGAQRNVKIIGIFARLCDRDGKPQYLGFLPRVWRYLERDLAHPQLAPLRAWFDAHVPADKRGRA